jgi:hypothetical protein
MLKPSERRGAALDGRTDKAREPLQELLAFRRCDYRQRVQTKTETGNIPPADRSGILGNNNVKDYTPYLDYPKPRKPATNADRIREWSDEEIAEFTIGVMDSAFELFTGAKMPDENRRVLKTEWLEWLKQEAKE